MSEGIRTSIESAIGYLTEHPDEAAYTDSPATATLVEGLRFRVEGPNAAVETDMPASVGGTDSAPSAGWLFRAALASCVGTLVAMRAAQEGVTIDSLTVEVDSKSDDRGLLGMDPGIPAGPSSISIRVHAESDAPAETLREIVVWGSDHCPVCDIAKRAVPVELEIG
ncbi:MAG: OsmC family protein [Actinomycetota bacterium]